MGERFPPQEAAARPSGRRWAAPCRAARARAGRGGPSGRARGARRRGRAARTPGPGRRAEVEHARTEHGVGDQTHAVQVDDDGRVPDVGHLRHGQSVRQRLCRVAAAWPSTSYGEQMAWHPERPKFHPLRLRRLVARQRSGTADRGRDRPRSLDRGLLGRAGGCAADRDPQRHPAPDRGRAAVAVHGAARVRARARARRAHAAAGRGDQAGGDHASTTSAGRCSPRSSLLPSSVVLAVVFGTNDDDTYTLQGRPPDREATGRRDAHGHAGHRLPRDRRPRLTGAAPGDAGRQRAEHGALDGGGLVRADRSGSRTSRRRPGRARPASCSARTTTFRRSAGWTSRPGRIIACSGPDDCAEIERERATGIGLLTNGGSSRGNLLSGEADEVILTVSRISEEKKANPGYRAFFANGFNVTRSLVLFFWEIVLEVSAALTGGAAGRPASRAPRAASTRCCARRCASSSATSSSTACSRT